MSHRGAHEAGGATRRARACRRARGNARPGRLAHASSCVLHGAIGMNCERSPKRPVDVPEPPAFFWSRLSARVRASIAEEPLRGLVVLAWRRWSRPAIAIAAAVVIVEQSRLDRGCGRGTRAREPPAVALQTQDDGEAGEDVFAEIDNDEAWALVHACRGSRHEQRRGGRLRTAGSSQPPDLQLTAAERIELARLLEEQLKGRRIPDSAS